MNTILKKKVLSLTIAVTMSTIFASPLFAQPPGGGHPQGMQNNQQQSDVQQQSDTGQQQPGPQQGGPQQGGQQQGEADPAAIISRMDSNDDGVVTLDDLTDHALNRTEREFERLDSDDDGYISETEFTSRPGRGQNDTIDHDALVQCIEESTGITLKQRPDSEEEFAAADTNGDAYLSYDELLAYKTAQVEERFAEMDTNSDGVISEEEITANMTERQTIQAAHQTCIQEQLLLDSSSTSINPLIQIINNN